MKKPDEKPDGKRHAAGHSTKHKAGQSPLDAYADALKANCDFRRSIGWPSPSREQHTNKILSAIARRKLIDSIKKK